jgi:hypothetical protein
MNKNNYLIGVFVSCLSTVVFSAPVEVISSNTTLYISPSGNDSTSDGTVSNPWATPHRALEYLNGSWISPDAIVTINAQNGTYNLSRQIDVQHPCGANISIEGSGGVIFNFTSGTSGIIVQKGSVLGYINGIRLTGDGINGRGMMAQYNSLIFCGSDMEIDHFYDGIVAKDNSFIEAQHAYVHHNVYRGMLSVHRGVIQCNYARSEYNQVGIGIDDGSYLYAHYAQANNNSKYGFWARNSSKAFAAMSTANNNGQYGYYFIRDCFINADQSTSIGNGTANYSPAISTSNVPNFGNAGSWIYGDPNE